MGNKKKYKLGIDLSFAKKRWPEPEKYLDIVANHLGVKYLEFDSDVLDPLYFSEPVWRRLAKETAEMASGLGVEIHNYFTGTMTHCVNLLSHYDEEARADGMRWCREALKVASALGARGIGGHFDTISSRDLMNLERYSLLWNNLVQAGRQLAREAHALGHEFLLWEQIYAPSEVPYTIEQTKRLFSELNGGEGVPVELVIDLGHACCQNFPHKPEDTDPYEWLRQLGGITRVVHLQQCDGKGSRHWPFTPEYNSIGIVEPQKTLDALDESRNEDIYLFMEIFFSLGDSDEVVLEAMKRSVDYWRKFVED